MKLVRSLVTRDDPEPVTYTPQEEDTDEPITSTEVDGYRPWLTPRNLVSES